MLLFLVSSAISMQIKYKIIKCCFFFSHGKHKKHMGFIYSKLYIFFYYQITTNCILIKTQPQLRKQTKLKYTSVENYSVNCLFKNILK